jgi:hypothetical protein
MRKVVGTLAVAATLAACSAGVRLWIRVSNPNPFGFTLSTLAGTLRLEGANAATGDFPVGLPLAARGDSVIPLDLSITLTDVPRLAAVLGRAATGAPIGYELDGTIGVDARRLGQPTFGPMRLVPASCA